MKKLDELETLAKAADAGPWHAGRSDTVSHDANGGVPYKYVYGTETEKHPRTGDDIPIEVGRGEGGNCIANAQHIAAFNPETALRLVYAIRAAVRMRDTVPGHSGGDQVDTDTFDAAMAALEAP